ncbi:L,D-transpeptidase family protein [Bacillus sp. 1006-3]|uniref:L,D-transpeptidase family protein n=1 Tax=unclassified Bacillus (in: firmicutes) TaxID=185979 RepID=UPI001F0D3953|nr:hypothetical protein [Bacillus sp. 1006-3]MCH4866657.1 hypothetical protein [Bacillus sp. 1006-3]
MKIKKWGLIAATVIILLPMFGNLANAAEPLDKGKNDWKFSTYERSTKTGKTVYKNKPGSTYKIWSHSGGKAYTRKDKSRYLPGQYATPLYNGKVRKLKTNKSSVWLYEPKNKKTINITKNTPMKKVKKINHKVSITIRGESNGWFSTDLSGNRKKMVYVKASDISGDKYWFLKKKTKSKPKPQNNDANKLKTVGKNKQLILVTANGYGTSKAQIQTFERDKNGYWVKKLSVSGYIGKYGFAKKMSEGGKASPRGKYTIGTTFGRVKNPGTKMTYRKITNKDVWVDDVKSNLYNTWQKKPTKNRWKSAEEMNQKAYQYGFVINYNTKRTRGAGSAIFFHVSNMYTLGCTGTSQTNVVKIMKWLDPKKNPVIIQTPKSELKKY